MKKRLLKKNLQITAGDTQKINKLIVEKLFAINGLLCLPFNLIKIRECKCLLSASKGLRLLFIFLI